MASGRSVVVHFEVDTSEADAKLKDVDGEIKKIKTSVEEGSKVVDNATKKVKSSLDNITEGIGNVDRTTKTTQSSLDNFFNKTAESSTKVTEAITKFRGSLTATLEGFEGFVNVVNNINNTLKRIEVSVDNVSASNYRLIQSYNSLTISISDYYALMAEGLHLKQEENAAYSQLGAEIGNLMAKSQQYTDVLNNNTNSQKINYDSVYLSTLAYAEQTAELLQLGRGYQQLTGSLSDASLAIKEQYMAMNQAVTESISLSKQDIAVRREMYQARMQDNAVIKEGVGAINSEVNAYQRAIELMSNYKVNLTELAIAQQEESAKMTASWIEQGNALTSIEEKVMSMVSPLRQLGITSSTASMQMTATGSQAAQSFNTADASLKKLNTDLASTSTAAKSASSSIGVLGTTLDFLKGMINMVGVLLVFNLAYGIQKAAQATVNAKSEMESLQQAMRMSSSEIATFNDALDVTVSKFQKISKYALGETVASLGVEFNLTTEEMKKSMSVVSMIQSEYVRAGRTQEEATLAVKDILQGEFLRLSRETGVGQSELKAAGWSGDVKDLNSLLEALDKVGKSRHWDVFASKAQSLGDVMNILRARVGEFAADLSDYFVPVIVAAFNAISDALTWINNGLEGMGATTKAISQWGFLITLLGTAYIALRNYTLGLGMLDVANLKAGQGLAATILKLNAETVAYHGVNVAIGEKITKYNAETVAALGSRNAILAKILGLSEEAITNNTLAGAIGVKTMAEIKERKEAQLSVIAIQEKTGAMKQVEAASAKDTIIKQARAEATKAEAFADLTSTQAIITKILALDAEVVRQKGLKVAILSSITATEAETVANWGLAASFAAVVAAAAPILIVTAIIVGLSVAIYELGKSFGWWKDVRTMLKAITDGIKELWDAFINSPQVVGTIKDITGAFQWLYQVLSPIGQAIADFFDIPVGSNGEWDILNVIIGFFGAIGGLAGDAVNAVKGFFGEIQNIPSWIYNNIIAPIQTFINDPIGSIGGAIQGTGSWILKLLGLDNIDVNSFVNEKIITPLTSEISLFLQNPLEYIVGAGKNILLTLLGINDSDGTQSQTTNTELFTIISSALTYVVTNAPTIAYNLGVSIGNAIWNGLKAIPIIGPILEFLASIADKNSEGKEKGKDLGENTSDGLNDGLDFKTYVEDELDEIGKALDGAWDWLGKKAEDLGAWLSSKFGKIGLGHQSPGKLAKTMASEMEYVGYAMENAKTNLGDIAENVGNYISQSFSSVGESPIDMSLDPNAMNQFSTENKLAMALATQTATDTTQQFMGMGTALTTVFDDMGNTVLTNFTNMATTQDVAMLSMQNTQKTALTNINTTTSTQMAKMRDTTVNVTTQMTNAWLTMKNNIVSAAQSLKSESEIHFNSLSDTIGNFYIKLQNPSRWGGGDGTLRKSNYGGYHKARAEVRNAFGIPSKSFAGSPIKKEMKLTDLLKMICPNGSCFNVDVASFLQMFASNGGFGWNDWDIPHYNHIKNTTDEWSMKGPSIMHRIDTGTTFKVKEFEGGKPKISFGSFQHMAESLFSAIPYDFYYNSEKHGSWVKALQAGACNCWDGANALIALARTCGFDGHMEHGTWNGIPHVFAVINGKKMDTTGWQQRRSWQGVSAGGPSKPIKQGDTYNITVDMSNSTIYGVEDLDDRVQNVTREVLLDVVMESNATGV